MEVRSMYAILPEVVYQGTSLVPQHTDPLSQQVIPATAIYVDGGDKVLTFAEKFPGARQSLDGTKRLIKDCNWTRRDLFGLEMLIALAGFQPEVDGVQVYGVMQYFEAVEALKGAEWVTPEV